MQTHTVYCLACIQPIEDSHFALASLSGQLSRRLFCVCLFWEPCHVFRSVCDSLAYCADKDMGVDTGLKQSFCAVVLPCQEHDLSWSEDHRVSCCDWAARYNTGLLIKSMPKGAVLPVSFSFLSCCVPWVAGSPEPCHMACMGRHGGQSRRCHSGALSVQKRPGGQPSLTLHLPLLGAV
jgi:hypothetical protein